MQKTFPESLISLFRDTVPQFSCMAVSGMDTGAVCFGFRRRAQDSGRKKLSGITLGTLLSLLN
jgi:hypothetical protein